MALCRQMQYEIGEIYSEMTDLKVRGILFFFVISKKVKKFQKKSKLKDFTE